MRLVAFLLVPLLAVAGWQVLRREQNERRLALVVTEVAQRDVGVDCPGLLARLVEVTPNAGWVDFDEHGLPSDRAHLSGSTCRSLERLWRADEPPSFGCLRDVCLRETFELVAGIVTLAHESWHLRGVTNEAQTQCYAIQTAELVGLRLGVAPADARSVADFLAARDANAPPGDYHSPECRPGGSFDLHPETGAWPD
ncbi:MAG: hypothetical protein H0V45_09090 [Actinobacteria bacterium]|nr:hypothetical protein [Actinomycetota bacterium]